MPSNEETMELLENILEEVIQESNPRQKFQQVLDNRLVEDKKRNGEVRKSPNGNTLLKNNPDGDQWLQKVVDDETSRLYKAREKGHYQTGAFSAPSLTNKNAINIHKKAYDDVDETHNQHMINHYKNLSKKYREIGYDKTADSYEDNAQKLIQKNTEMGRRDKEAYKRMLNAIPNATITTNRRGKTKIRYEAAQILIEALNTLLNE